MLKKSRIAVALAMVGLGGVLWFYKSQPKAERAQANTLGLAHAVTPKTAPLPDSIESTTEAAPSAVVALSEDQWIHPVLSSTESFPVREARRFGARRKSRRPRECRRGHCGVDLGGPRGTPILAVEAGIVEYIGRNPRRPSGLYVKLRHNTKDGARFFTSYMHLDKIRPGLDLGMFVEAGEQIGTLGRTGIRHSEAHLHFEMKVEGSTPKLRGLFVDPGDRLESALVLEEPRGVGRPSPSLP